jgi:glycine/sarcosine N-methyltransferase
MSQVNEQTPASFYDWLAADYDAMTDFEKRFALELPVYRRLVERYSITTAVDAGCGTGFLALLLARIGVRVTAVDISPGMLEATQRHARDMELPVDTLESTFANLPQHINAPVDALFSMGNALAHLRSRDELLQALTSFRAVLRTGGVLFLQILNYDRIMLEKERIQNVREAGNAVFVRFYDYLDDALRFNILTLRRLETGLQHDLQSVTLRPILSMEILELLEKAGFHQPGLYAGPSLEQYSLHSSKDLLAIGVVR